MELDNTQTKKHRMLDCPVIAAVKDEAGLAAALKSECEVIFLLFGSVVNVADLVERVRGAGKLAIVHIDLLDGLSQREVAVDGLTRMCAPDGIISTRPALVRRARHLGLLTVQRAFILDSLALSNLPAQLSVGAAALKKKLPGIMPPRRSSPAGSSSTRTKSWPPCGRVRRRCPPPARRSGRCETKPAGAGPAESR